ncbi:MAG: hypothetical protein CFE21_04205 [Bacteroidetes bacterium B1(2017)]|nr:MAG: hypothetical protein CFE21_04205 [Bacteroidetes bacterium B1(2017)]
MTFSKKLLLALFLYVPSLAFSQEFLRWADEFNGTNLDTTFWEYQLGDGCPNLCGWGNGESQYYQKSAVVVENGLLKIKAKKETIGTSFYSSARIRTINKMDFASGRIEVRARMPIGRGYWPAVWFLPTENYYGIWPLSGEIDMLEAKGQEPTNTYGTIHYGARTPNNKYTGTTYTLPSGSFASDFHRYGLIWKNDTIKWLVDDVVYSTKTRASLPEFWWPYDRNFHCIINMAVGGNFLGYPDASTPDTATMQVDYIRIYQNPSEMFISGPAAVMRLDQQKEYYIQNLAGATYTWEVPSSLKIVSGQGTSAVKINWGLRSDSIHVNLTYNGKTTRISRFIQALPDTCAGLVDNAEFIKSIYWVGSNGTHKSSLTNPTKDAVNGSNLANRYYRNGATQYDALTLYSDLIHHAKDFEEGKLVLKMKLYTTAPIGTEVNINFENYNLAKSDYPIGRRIVVQAKTTKTRAWEELTFKVILRPDVNMNEGSIDQLVVLFAPNTSNADVFYYDDFAVEETPCKDLANGLNTLEEQAKVTVYPNPFSKELYIESSFVPTKIEVVDIMGRVQAGASGLNQLNTQLENLPAGTYLLRIYNGEQAVLKRILKTTNGYE